MTRSWKKGLGLLVPLCALVPLLAPSSAFAVGPWWRLNTSLRPSTLQPGGEGTIVVAAVNVGDACTASAPGEDGKFCTGDDLPTAPVTVTAKLPAGAEVVEGEVEGKMAPHVAFLQSPNHHENFGPSRAGVGFLELCKVTPGVVSVVTCTTAVKPEFSGFFHIGPFAPYEQIEMQVRVRDHGIAPGAVYEAQAGGGGAPVVSESRPLTVSPAAPVFGAEALSLVPEEEGGGVDARAGSHPFQLTNTFNLNQNAGQPSHEELAGEEFFAPPALARNLSFKLPAGQLGNVTAYPKCSLLQFSSLLLGGANLCPDSSAIGVAAVTIDESVNNLNTTVSSPLFNLETARGEPARFGFVVASSPVILDASLRSGKGEDYGVTVTAPNTPQAVNFIASTVTFWGTPGDPRHDASRGWGCLAGGYYVRLGGGAVSCSPVSQAKPPAFLTLPADCAAPFATSVEGVSWPNVAFPAGAPLAPLGYSLKDPSGNSLGLVGCNQVPFAPEIKAEPTSNAATSPTGLSFDLNVNDEGLINSEGIAASEIKKAVVALPEGMTANPSLAAGLTACSAAQYESESITSPAGAGCPNESKIGDVEVTTPLLTQTLHGALYIARQGENPFGSLLALYVVIKNPETGVLIKLAGKVEPNPVTGQLVSVFDNIPELPFGHFRLHFREGQRSPLVTPPACGEYTTHAELYPWSNPGTPLQDSSVFQVTTGVGGGPCPTGGVPPFAPVVTAGTLNNVAGAYTPFDIRITRNDNEQEITGFTSQLPPGLTANLSGIPFCTEAQIATARTKSGIQEEAEPSCPAASQIGHTLVGVGVASVLAYTPGKLYMAGPFEGAPFSLAAITSAHVGPFDLGTVVVHLPLHIDPATAAVSIPAGPADQIPHIIKGIVVHVRDIRVYVDREKFMLNPTSCNPLAFSATVIGAGQNFVSPADDVPATVSDPFQAANCQNLQFKPGFKVAATGKNSKTNGAGLSVKLTYPSAPQGSQANIAKVKVALPKQLPSRLTTLQKACTAKQFKLNPAGCPPESVIGHAKAITPILPVPLEGPAYFVSNGGEAFPNLIVVLQGYGVTIDLVGSTFISKTGITSSTFKTVPDQPIGSFELTLPEGPFSALAANGNLCKSKLKMPTEFVAQNGAVIKRSTKVSVTGCKKAKKAAKHRQGKRGKRK